MVKKSQHKKRGFFRNVKPSLLLLLLPIAAGLAVIFLIGSGIYVNKLTNIGSNRLITKNWQQAGNALQQTQPQYGQKFAYYKVKLGQTLADLSTYFSVDQATLTKMNPGIITAGTTIKVPPVQHPLVPTSGSNGLISNAVVTNDGDMIRVTNKYGKGAQIVTTIPELMQFLKPYGAISEMSNKVFLINKAFSLDENIRLDITPTTVSKLLLRSSPYDVSCLCMDGGVMLIQDVSISSYDPATEGPDTNSKDGRAFIRMLNGRMDILNSDITWLGNPNKDENVPGLNNVKPSLREGGVYGTSWRVSKGMLGINIATGWVENNTFEHNHFGAYSFGASGIMWKSNQFSYNEIYGLDPHDDSNNATIEDNVFSHNSKHGFIMSKRCNYNIVKDNISYDNKYHGFMLHENSAYNLVEDNISYGNTDNYVIYNSNFNTIRDNKSYNPKSSGIRINQPSYNNFITDNQLYGGGRGIYLYDGVNSTYISGNTILGTKKIIQTSGATNTYFAQNIISSLTYEIPSSDRFVYGPNDIENKTYIPINPDKIAKQIR
jgi:parallel beta-helix repeat protein